MDFITLDGKIIFIEDKLYFKKILAINENRYSWTIGFCFLLSYKAIDDIFDVVEKNNHIIYAVVSVLLIISIICISFFESIFYLSHKKEINIQAIKRIKIMPTQNELQTEVRLVLQRNRYKKCIFRNAENQVDAFIAHLLSANENIIYDH